MHNNCTNKATSRLQLRVLGHFNRWLQSKDSPRTESICRHWNATCVADANPASCAEYQGLTK